MRQPGPLPAPVALHPTPHCAGTCPRDGEPLEVVRLHIPGWRIAVEGDCRACNHRYVQDLPNGHGQMNPATLDLDSGETLDPWDAFWFSSWLRRSWERPDLDPVHFKPERRAGGGQAVLLNCLDPVYGHALLKLLSAARVADGAGSATSVVLLPRALAHLVPSEVDERWVVDEPVGRFGSWLLDLEASLRKELTRFDEVRLVAAPVQPHPSTLELDRFVGDVEPERAGEPSIALSLRDDRRWGRTLRDEGRRVTELVESIVAAYPTAGFTAVGVGTPGALPARVHDLRRRAPSGDDEQRWLGVLRGADLAIGVHGSNLLLPSALARATVELLPRGRYGNLFQATIVQQEDPLLALDRHRTLYGDAELVDIGASRVADVAITVLDGIERFAAHATGPAAGVGSQQARPLRAGPNRSLPEPSPGLPERIQRFLLGIRTGLRAAAGRLAAPRYPGGRQSPTRALDERLTAALDALPAAERSATLRVDAAQADAFAALDAAGTALDRGALLAVIVTGLHDDGRADTRPRSRAVFERLEAAGLRPHGVDGDRLVPIRPVGPLREPTLVVGLSAPLVSRLRAAGLVS